jgi:sensor histidine kinase YesM
MKHPVIQNSTRLIVWWLVWSILGLGQYFLFYSLYGSAYSSIIPDIIISFALYSVIALVLWYPFGYFNRTITKPLVLVTNLILTGVLTITFWVLVTRFIISHVLPESSDYNESWLASFPYRIGSGVFIYGLVILTYYLFESFTSLAEKSAKEAQLETLVRDTELRMLRSQINPHFLFNSLNSITSLTVTDPEKARTMVIKLSDFMRYALSRKDEQPVTLQSELDNLRLYLDIEKVRFGNRLTIEENINKECLNSMLPVMLLQPLYENAVKHGVYDSLETVVINTTVSCQGDSTEITISNNYDPAAKPQKGTGTGLLNVSRRLELLYGNKAGIITRKDEKSFTVKLFIPSASGQQ